MYLSELIYNLEQKLEEHGDIKVMSTSDYGDHCHTEQMVEIKSVKVTKPIDSAYSESGWAFPDDRDLEDIRPDRIGEDEVLGLRYKSEW